jgi:hypothetical protein
VWTVSPVDDVDIESEQSEQSERRKETTKSEGQNETTKQETSAAQILSQLPSRALHIRGAFSQYNGSVSRMSTWGRRSNKVNSDDEIPMPDYDAESVRSSVNISLLLSQLWFPMHYMENLINYLIT